MSARAEIPHRPLRRRSVVAGAVTSGAMMYADKASVNNLTATANGTVNLYAVWAANPCTVTIGSTWGEGGSATYDYGSTVTLYAPGEVVDAAGTTKYVCLGSSRFPDKGTNVTLTVTGNVSFSWDVWETNYWISVETSGTGTVSEDGSVFRDGWRTNGCPVVLTAEPAGGFTFTGWTGDLDGSVAEDATLALAVDRPRALGVSFAVQEPENVALPAISPADGATFATASCAVTLTCETAGAVIYYTTNGRTPRQAESYRYKGAFTITDTTTVLAFAVKDGRESELLEATITKVEPVPLTLKGALDEVKLGEVTTDGTSEWVPLMDVDAQVGDAFVRSGAVGMEQTTWMETTVSGAGTLTFWWKTSCEADPRGRYTYDHAVFEVDGEIRARLDGESGWHQVTLTLNAAGSHTLRWSYETDDWEEPGYQDCVWVDGVTWSGAEAAGTETQTTEVPVPYAWLDGYFPGVKDYESKARAMAANGLNTVEEAYVAGFDPTDPSAALRASVELAYGKVCVSWSPNLNTGSVSRIYTVWGRAALDDATGWVTPATAAHRFFKVTVSMPTGANGEETAVSGEGVVSLP